MRTQILTISLIILAAVSGFMFLRLEPNKSETVAVGSDKKAPDFTLKTTDGKIVKLSDYKGKGVIVNFWATWCGPCRAEIPDMVELQKEYEGKGFSFIGIALSDEDEKVKAFVAEQKMNYPVGLGSQELAMSYGKFTKEGEIRGIPTSFVINAKGEIIDYFIGGRDRATFSAAIQKIATK